jgi:predicted DNA-binding transcriptional regulator YafY
MPGPASKGDLTSKSRADPSRCGGWRGSRLSRCLRLVSLLISGVAYNGCELSRQFGVSKRTLFRDLKDLREAEVPLRFDPVRHGYVVEPLPEGRLFALSSEERLLLLLAAQTSILTTNPAFREAVHQAIAKVVTDSSSTIRLQASRALSAWNLPQTTPGSLACSPEVAQGVFEAFRRGWDVRVEYCDEDGTGCMVRTRIAPTELTVGLREWRLLGRSSVHRSTVSLPLKQVRWLEPVED